MRDFPHYSFFRIANPQHLNTTYALYFTTQKGGDLLKENEKDTVKFIAKIRAQGESKVFSIPPELVSFLELSIESQITLIGAKGKKGKFIAFWKNQ